MVNVASQCDHFSQGPIYSITVDYLLYKNNRYCFYSVNVITFSRSSRDHIKRIPLLMVYQLATCSEVAPASSMAFCMMRALARCSGERPVAERTFCMRTARPRASRSTWPDATSSLRSPLNLERKQNVQSHRHRRYSDINIVKQIQIM